MDVLDKVSEDKQFRNLVANNDRKGAAELLRALSSLGRNATI